MKILQITNRKGGVGKTTIACHAAWYFGESKRVLFVELDTQRNASRTLQPHKSRVVASDLLNGSVEIPGLPGPGIKVISADDGLKSVSIDPARHMVQMRRNLEAAGANYEVCILDTAPSADTLNIGPLLFASHVLAPIELNVTVRAGSKTFLVPKAKSSDEAMKLVQDHLGKAVVRVGLTQYPVGIGVTDKSQVTADVFDTCNNIKIGTALFARVYRVVTKWYGTPVQEAFEDAIEAYQTGYFDGDYVFTAEDPGESVELAAPDPAASAEGAPAPEADNASPDPRNELRQQLWAQDPNKADIGVDLSGIGDFNRE